MELDERKKKILKVIIQNYMETGEPVGSRTISKDPDLKLPSAMKCRIWKRWVTSFNPTLPPEEFLPIKDTGCMWIT